MSLQLILGSSGSGKSYRLYHKIIEDSISNEGINYLVIVPEQFTMQTQKDLVSMHPYKSIMNIDILSFPRLAYRVFDELGGDKRLVLEDTGKSMVIRKIIEEKSKELILFSANAKRQGFIEELKSLISELFQYSITTDTLGTMVESSKGSPMLHSKLNDVWIVFKGFKEFLSEKYITAEELLDALCEVIERSNLLKNSVICLDGFTGFTPSQYKLLSYLMRLASKVMITVTIDERENPNIVDQEFKLFHLSKKTIRRLHDIAEQNSIEVEKPYFVQKERNRKVPYRFKDSPALAALERNLYRYPIETFSKEQESISIHVLTNPEKEVQFVSREIRRLLEEDNYRYKDIAVVTGDIVSYGRIIEREFPSLSLPFFIDHKKDVMTNPCVEFVRSVLEIIRRDFTYESVFRFLRCGLIDFDSEEVDILENYVIAFGVRGYKRWKEPFVKKRKKEEIDLDSINVTRAKLIEKLEPLYGAFKQKEQTVREFTKALFYCMEAFEIQEKLESYTERFEDEEKPLLAKEYRQIYSILLELFDKIVDLLGEERIPLKEYCEILESGFQEAEVGLIPPGMDQIVIGDIERTRLKDIKALFFIGVNDGIIPKVTDSGGILTDMDREFLASCQVELAPTVRQNNYTSQFYQYLNLTKPQNRLFVTYSKLGNDGKSMRPSQMIGTLLKLFPLLNVIDEEKHAEEFTNILGEKQGLEYLIRGLREYTPRNIPPEWRELFLWYYKQEEFQPYMKKLIEGAFYVKKESYLGKAVANVLYGNELSGSVTRLEKYAACAFAHFLSYGLELSERKEYKLAVPDIGNIFHDAIDSFSKRVEESDYEWNTIPDGVREEYVRQSVREAAVEYAETALLSNKRNEYMLLRIERITRRTIWALCEHIKSGEFTPKGFELQFSYLDNLESVNIPLSERENMRLTGRIDRLDVMEEDDKVYVKVIDYKSGTTSFDIVTLYYGLQLQLVVYLDAALELQEKKNPNKEIIPAGIFYYNIEDPIIDKNISYADLLEKRKDSKIAGSDVMIQNKIDEELIKELKMNGLANQNIDIAKRMDQSLVDESGEPKRSAKSYVIPMELNKDGVPTKRSSTATSKQFGALTKYVRGKIGELGRRILDGEADVLPYRLGDKTACDYCEYDGICGFDSRMPGCSYRSLKKLEKEEVWEKIMEEIKETKE